MRRVTLVLVRTRDRGLYNLNPSLEKLEKVVFVSMNCTDRRGNEESSPVNNAGPMSADHRVMILVIDQDSDSVPTGESARPGTPTPIQVSLWTRTQSLRSDLRPSHALNLSQVAGDREPPRRAGTRPGSLSLSGPDRPVRRPGRCLRAARRSARAASAAGRGDSLALAAGPAAAAGSVTYSDSVAVGVGPDGPGTHDEALKRLSHHAGAAAAFIDSEAAGLKFNRRPRPPRPRRARAGGASQSESAEARRGGPAAGGGVLMLHH